MMTDKAKEAAPHIIEPGERKTRIRRALLKSVIGKRKLQS